MFVAQDRGLCPRGGHSVGPGGVEGPTPVAGWKAQVLPRFRGNRPSRRHHPSARTCRSAGSCSGLSRFSYISAHREADCRRSTRWPRGSPPATNQTGGGGVVGEHLCLTGAAVLLAGLVQAGRTAVQREGYRQRRLRALIFESAVAMGPLLHDASPNCALGDSGAGHPGRSLTVVFGHAAQGCLPAALTPGGRTAGEVRVGERESPSHPPMNLPRPWVRPKPAANAPALRGRSSLALGDDEAPAGPVGGRAGRSGPPWPLTRRENPIGRRRPVSPPAVEVLSGP